MSPENMTGISAPSSDAAKAFELFTIAGSLSSTLDLDFLLEKIGLAAERLLDSEASSIMLVTDDKKSLYFKVASGSSGSVLKKMTLPIGRASPAGWRSTENPRWSTTPAPTPDSPAPSTRPQDL